MMRKPAYVLLAGVLCASFAPGGEGGAYKANWESLDARPVPQWWCDAKFGIFIHWGPYSVPAFAPTDEKEFSHCYAEWYQGRVLFREVNQFAEHHRRHYGNMPYGNFAAQFSARFFDPAKWAELFKRAGAKYVILTAKHHDGYALWPSAESPYYNSTALGSGRDLCGELSGAVRAAGLRMGFYYSLVEYANPRFLNRKEFGEAVWSLDSTNNFSLTFDVRNEEDPGRWAREINLPQMKELADRYLADIIWADGGQWRKCEDLHSEEFLAWLYNESKVRDHVVVNDRWGNGLQAVHGGHYTTEYGRLNGKEAGDLPHPWEECRGVGRSFGYNRFERTEDYLRPEELIRMIVRTVSRGGNFLLDIGPDADGIIPVIMEERLLQIGEWLGRHGDAIYGTQAGPVALGEKVVSTRKGEVINLFAMDASVDDVEIELNGAKRRVRFGPASEPVRVVSIRD